MVVSKTMTFYPSSLLFNFFDHEDLNYLVTLFTFLTICRVFVVIIDRYFKRQVKLYVSKHIFKKVSYTDKMLNKVSKFFRVLEIMVMITTTLSIYEQSEIFAMLTQLIFTIALFLKLFTQMKRNWIWKKLKKVINKEFEKSSQQINAVNKLYRLLIIQTIIEDIFIIPIYLCVMEFVGLFPYLLSDRGF